MKLLQVIASMDPRTGGPCQAVRNQYSEIVKSENTMEVVCLDNPDSDYLVSESLPIHALGRGRGPWNYNPGLSPWLDENLFRFNAVILNGLWQYPGYALSRASQRPNTPPYFVFPHGMLDPWFQRAPERRLKAIRNWFHWKLIEQHVIHNAKAAFFTCMEEMRLARDTFRPYQPKLELNVGCGIARPPRYHQRMEAAFASKCPGLNGRSFFLFLGRIDPKKGVDLSIKGFAEFCRSTINSSSSTSHPRCLVIAGPGLDTQYGKQMQELAARICPPDSVFWPGMLTGDAKWGALNHAEAFVLTSHQENFGIAVVEALACGTPVLISNQINIWREIDENKAGLVAADTLEGTEHLFKLWQGLSTAEKIAMKQAAQTCYEKHFCIHLATQKLLAAVQDMTEPRPAQ